MYRKVRRRDRASVTEVGGGYVCLGNRYYIVGGVITLGRHTDVSIYWMRKGWQRTGTIYRKARRKGRGR